MWNVRETTAARLSLTEGGARSPAPRIADRKVVVSPGRLAPAHTAGAANPTGVAGTRGAQGASARCRIRLVIWRRCSPVRVCMSKNPPGGASRRKRVRLAFKSGGQPFRNPDPRLASHTHAHARTHSACTTSSTRMHTYVGCALKTRSGAAACPALRTSPSSPAMMPAVGGPWAVGVTASTAALAAFWPIAYGVSGGACWPSPPHGPAAARVS